MRQVTALMFVVLIAASTVCIGQDEELGFLVVGHPTTTPDSVSKTELTRIFLKQRKSWSNGHEALPVDQKTTTDLREQFSIEMLDRSLREIDSYWQGQVFSGRESPPPIKRSDQEVIDYVSSTPGAVGYVSSSADTHGVKILTVT